MSCPPLSSYLDTLHSVFVIHFDIKIDIDIVMQIKDEDEDDTGVEM